MQSINHPEESEEIYHICFSLAGQIPTNELLYHGGAVVDFSPLIWVHESIFLLEVSSILSVDHLGIALQELLQQGLVNV